ncbi:methyltransferase [Amorphoplanes nipponensis]|uniref:50S ribosomal protein L11 methyltransferase n=1 Tax=Actinoplanes nipponensis TaxID=135950 RepID=A0A919JJE6_9ACTN|nr:50S ribosomal protein L11 methyltransferase [Actinoplanes nipponensis]GIE47874.1 50S ribosomal protein L11 methyltransferase [Actinoplanes nipponensis]
MKTYSGAPYAAATHSALQRRLLRNASFPPRTAQQDALKMSAVPMVPEVHLFLAEDSVLLWARLETEDGPLSAPYWATPWPGGQALARYVLDNPELVAGRRVLDLASGSGLVAIAAALAGAAEVTANDTDGYAIAAIQANANANGVLIATVADDLTDGDGEDYEVILAGDCLYTAEVAAKMLPFIGRAMQRGATVLLGDPGRGYAPPGLLRTLTTYESAPLVSGEDGQRDQTSVLTPVAVALTS